MLWLVLIVLLVFLTILYWVGQALLGAGLPVWAAWVLSPLIVFGIPVILITVVTRLARLVANPTPAALAEARGSRHSSPALREDESVVIDSPSVKPLDASGPSPAAARVRELQELVAAKKASLRNATLERMTTRKRFGSSLDWLYQPVNAYRYSKAVGNTRKAQADYIRSIKDDLAQHEKELQTAWARLQPNSPSMMRRIRFRGTFGRVLHFDLDEDEYARFELAQRECPALLTTWHGKRLWWYLDRFWWDSDGLSPEGVQALILQQDDH